MVSTIFDILMITVLLLAYGAVCVFITFILLKWFFSINVREIKLRDLKGADFWSQVWTILLVSAMIFGIYLLFKTMMPRYKVYFERLEGYSNGKELLPDIGEDVFVCTGSGSCHYHYKQTCFELKSCSDMIAKMEAGDAEDEGYSPCNICFMIEEKYYIK